MLRGQVGRTPGSPGLLVGDDEEGEPARRRRPGAVQEALEHRCHRRGLVEHVDGAPPPDEAVDEVSCKGIFRPARLVRRDDIEMTHHRHLGRLRVAAGKIKKHAGSTGPRFVAMAGGVEILADGLNRPSFVPRLGKAVVDTPVANQVSEEFRYLPTRGFVQHVDPSRTVIRSFIVGVTGRFSTCSSGTQAASKASSAAARRPPVTRQQKSTSV